MPKCSTCGNEWTENYCPECARTIQPVSLPPLTQNRPTAETNEAVKKLPIEFPYNPDWRFALIFCIFAAGWAGVLVHVAIANRAGLNINYGLIILGPIGATRFYWGAAAAFAFLSLILGLATARGLLWPRVLVLETEALLLPTGLLQTRVVRIPYDEILEYQEIHYPKQKQTAFKIILRSQTHSLYATLLPNPENYAFVRAFLLSKRGR